MVRHFLRALILVLGALGTSNSVLAKEPLEYILKVPQIAQGVILMKGLKIQDRYDNARGGETFLMEASGDVAFEDVLEFYERFLLSNGWDTQDMTEYRKAEKVLKIDSQSRDGFLTIFFHFYDMPEDEMVSPY